MKCDLCGNKFDNLEKVKMYVNYSDNDKIVIDELCLCKNCIQLSSEAILLLLYRKEKLKRMEIENIIKKHDEILNKYLNKIGDKNGSTSKV